MTEFKTLDRHCQTFSSLLYSTFSPSLLALQQNEENKNLQYLHYLRYDYI